MHCIFHDETSYQKQFILATFSPILMIINDIFFSAFLIRLPQAGPVSELDSRNAINELLLHFRREQRTPPVTHNLMHY